MKWKIKCKGQDGAEWYAYEGFIFENEDRVNCEIEMCRRVWPQNEYTKEVVKS